jgi:hypothetical protein
MCCQGTQNESEVLHPEQQRRTSGNSSTELTVIKADILYIPLL